MCIRDRCSTHLAALAGHSVALVLDVAAPQLEDLQCVLSHAMMRGGEGDAEQMPVSTVEIQAACFTLACA